MSSAILISEFNRVAGQGIRLDKLNLRYQNNGQVIDATGWHDDGTPFAFVSQPFDGDPVQRVQQIAADLIRLHTGKPMPLPPTIADMAAALQAQITDIHTQSQQFMTDLAHGAAQHTVAMQEARKLLDSLNKATADLRTVAGAGNGGPAQN